MAWYDEQAEILAGGAKHLETAIAEALRHARNEALEEAARVADGMTRSWARVDSDEGAHRASTADIIAAAIRALKETAK